MSSVSVKQKMMVNGKAWLEYFGYCREPLLSRRALVINSWDVLILQKKIVSKFCSPHIAVSSRRNCVTLELLHGVWGPRHPTQEEVCASVFCLNVDMLMY